jgi:hypothetical protein
MIQNFINAVGESHPQLLREIKGRLKPINLIFTSTSSLFLQLVILLYQMREIPGQKYPLTDSYCLAGNPYLIQKDYLYKQKNLIIEKLSNHSLNTSASDLKLHLKHIESQIKSLENYLAQSFCPLDKIEWKAWSRDHWEFVFISFTVIFVFTLLVGGTYLLINDLVKEEKLGTLNFIRLSPQSNRSILIGKMLGVPSLIYIFILTAIPLHIWAGHAANIPLSYILIYYLVILASCYLFYIGALFLGLCRGWFSNFIPWIGSGVIAIFLWWTMLLVSSYLSYDSPLYHSCIHWLILMTPWEIINYLFPNILHGYSIYYHVNSRELYYELKHPLSQLDFLYLPIGKNLLSLVCLYITNCLICSHGIWQVVKRSFCQANITILSKRQSYFLMGFCQVSSIGLATSRETYYSEEGSLLITVFSQMLLNIAICLGLIFALSPNRQIIREWSRYNSQRHSYKSLFKDLIYGEKSPAILAIAINIIIAFIPGIIWNLFLPEIYQLNKTQFLLGLISFTILAMIYASIFQLVLLARGSKRYVLGLAILVFVVSLPIVISLILDDHIDHSLMNKVSHTIWLFSPFPWIGIKQVTMTSIYPVILAEFVVLVLLNFRLKRQLKSLYAFYNEI